MLANCQFQKSINALCNVVCNRLQQYKSSHVVAIESYADSHKLELLQTTGLEVKTRQTSFIPDSFLNESGKSDHNESEQSDVSVLFPKTGPKKRPPTLDEILNLVLSACKMGDNQMKLVPIDLWDFGGQKFYYMTHQLFISSRGIFIIIFNGSKEIHQDMSDLLSLPGQYGQKTIAGIARCWQNFKNASLSFKLLFLEL